MWQEGYPRVSVVQGHLAAVSLPVPSKLHWGSAVFLPILFYLHPPSSVDPPSQGTFCPTSSCPGHPRHRGRARWGLFWQPGDSLPSPHLNMTFSTKRLTLLPHALPASNYFQLTFLGGVGFFWVDWCFCVFTNLWWTLFFFPVHMRIKPLYLLMNFQDKLFP